MAKSDLRCCVTILFVFCVFHSNALALAVKNRNDVGVVKTKRYVVQVRDQECEPCPVGTFIKNCTGCPPGFCHNTSLCMLCVFNTYNNATNATECKPCPRGEVSMPGATHCRACPSGTEHQSNLTNLCDPCSPGWYNPNPASFCKPCNPGYESKMGSTSCSKCLSGSFNPFKGRPCLPCGVGKYNPESGATEVTQCIDCPGGYFCPYLETSQPQPCPPDYYCKPKSSQPTACQDLFESSSMSEDCQPKITLYLIILAGVAALIVFIAVFVYVRTRKPGGENKKGSSTNVANQVPMESDKLIPVPTGPVYEGL